MFSISQEQPLGNQNDQPSNHLLPKAQILRLLSLKQCIFEYQKTIDEIKEGEKAHRQKQMTVELSHETIKKQRRHQRLQSHADVQTKLQRKTKTHSERKFNKREVIEKNKRQLRGSQHLLRAKPRVQSENYNLFESKLKSIQVGHRKEFLKQGAIRAKGQTISHVKLSKTKIEESEIKTRGTLQNKFRTMMAKYRSNHLLEKTRMREVDMQHKQIEQIVNELTNTYEIKGEETNEGEDKVEEPKKFNHTVQVGKKMNAKSQRKEHQVRGLLKDRYLILQKIGKGLSGEVYKGKDILSERLVAIKVSNFSTKQSEYEFYKKVQHRHIVSYLNNFTQNGKRYLILQYLPHTLQTVTKHRKLTEQEVRKVFRSIVNVLMFLHGLSIAHRDIKLDNIVCSEDLSVIKLIDFGLCIDMNQENCRISKEFCGTLHYMPPEILQKRPYQPKKADIWALGVLLYRLAFDRFPYRGRDEHELLTKVMRSKLVFPEYCNSDLKQLLQKMLMRNPNSRLTMSEIIEDRWLV